MSFPPEGHRHSGRQNLDQRSRSLCRLKVLDLSTKPPACYLAPMGYCITSCLWRRPSRIDRLAAFPTVEIITFVEATLLYLCCACISRETPQMLQTWFPRLDTPREYPRCFQAAGSFDVGALCTKLLCLHTMD